MAASEPWARREDETDRAWQAFCAYRDLPASQRSIYAAWATVHPERRAEKERKKGGRENARKPPRRWENWSARHDWPARVRAYDIHLDRQRRAAQEAQHIAEIEAYRNRLLNASRASFGVATRLLNKLNARLLVLEEAEIEPGMIAAQLRAVAAVIEAAQRGEAQGLAVDRLILALGAEQREEHDHDPE